MCVIGETADGGLAVHGRLHDFVLVRDSGIGDVFVLELDGVQQSLTLGCFHMA